MAEGLRSTWFQLLLTCIDKRWSKKGHQVLASSAVHILKLE